MADDIAVTRLAEIEAVEYDCCIFSLQVLLVFIDIGIMASDKDSVRFLFMIIWEACAAKTCLVIYLSYKKKDSRVGPQQSLFCYDADYKE